MRSPLIRAMLPLAFLGAVLPLPAQPPPDPAALRELGTILQSYIAADLAVGAELLVMQNGRVLLQEAFGWQDRESGREMEPGALYNVRSLGQPLVGAAIQMLVDEGRIGLDDPVARYLPSFGHDLSSAITVRHLLTHTSGLPMSIVHSFSEFPSLRALADRAGAIGPQFEPGSGFAFSDTGIDVLGALAEAVSGRPLDSLVRDRLLVPLGMEDSRYFRPGEDVLERVCSSYEGQMGNWIRSGSAGDPPSSPYPLASQGLYCSPRDYARFLDLLLTGGKPRGTDTPLLSPRAVRDTLTPVLRALNPASPTAYPTAFPGLRVYYGQTLLLYLPAPYDANTKPELFGYSSVDGTSAWAWPERNLLVLLFTQSRGSSAGQRLEWEIDRLLVHPGRAPQEVPEIYRPCLGNYVADFGPHDNERFTVLVRDGRLALDIPSQGVYLLKDPDPANRWHFELAPEESVSFRPAGPEPAKEMRLHRGSEEIPVPREGSLLALLQELQRRRRLESWRRYTGTYRDETRNTDVVVALSGGRLALVEPGGLQYLLLPPSAGRWAFLVDPATVLTFQEDRGGTVVSCTISLPAGERRVLERVGGPPP